MFPLLDERDFIYRFILDMKNEYKMLAAFGMVAGFIAFGPAGAGVMGHSEMASISGGACTKFTHFGGERCSENVVESSSCEEDDEGNCTTDRYITVVQLGRHDSCDGEGSGCESAPDSFCDSAYFGDCIEYISFPSGKRRCGQQLVELTTSGVRNVKKPPGD
jgi:hypothetical protein